MLAGTGTLMGLRVSCSGVTSRGHTRLPYRASPLVSAVKLVAPQVTLSCLLARARRTSASIHVLLDLPGCCQNAVQVGGILLALCGVVELLVHCRCAHTESAISMVILH